MIERWLRQDARPEVLDQRLEWQPDPKTPALTIELPAYFPFNRFIRLRRGQPRIQSPMMGISKLAQATNIHRVCSFRPRSMPSRSSAAT